MILLIKNHIIWFPSVQHCNWFGFRISPSLSREGAIFRDEIENYFSCSRLPRRDRDYHMTILVFRDENDIPFCYSHVSRRDRDFRKSFLVVEREKMKLTLVENSRDREFSLTSDLNHGPIGLQPIALPLSYIPKTAIGGKVCPRTRALGDGLSDL